MTVGREDENDKEKKNTAEVMMRAHFKQKESKCTPRVASIRECFGVMMDVYDPITMRY